MDLLKDATKNLSLYEVKAYVRKAQNVAMNLTEMESKVREATNNEPWGALTKLMAQIASGTYNYREREEIISFIFRRFTEKATREWRQIYKALQLLDYLVRNGSERIIDDVRSNLSLILMLKSFHYIDSKGRDQGINVRNRAKNLVNLLNDDNQLRAERKKARSNQKKFGGVSSAAFGGASSIGTGDDIDDGDFTNRVFGDGGVYGARYGDLADEFNKRHQQQDDNNFEEYNVEGESSTSKPSNSKSQPTVSSSKVNAEPDLLGDLLGDVSSSAPVTTTGAPVATSGFDNDDDDFDDFQSAPTSNVATTTSGPSSNLNNLANLYQSQPSRPAAFNSIAPPLSGPPLFSSPSFMDKPATKVETKSNDAFSSLFTSAKSKRTPSGTAQDPPKSQPQPQPQSYPQNSQPTQSSNNTSNEIDLLSF